MINVIKNLWVGNSTDERNTDLPIDVVFNVAVDLRPTCGWPMINYYHIGLVDGPGNELGLYIAAVSALHAVLNEGKSVLLNCHKGESRSMAVAIMYIHLVSGRGWYDIIQAIRERAEFPIREPHEAHKQAFECINWELIRRAVV